MTRGNTSTGKMLTWMQSEGRSILVVRREASRELRARCRLGPHADSDAVALLRDWLHKQQHIKKKDLETNFLELILISSKGSVERAKSKIDRYCTLRAMMPEYFTSTSSGTSQEVFSLFKLVVCPEQTRNFDRIAVAKTYNYPITAALIDDALKYCVTLLEYCKRHDFSDGVEFVCDYLEESCLSNVLMNANPMLLTKIQTIFMNGCGVRIKAIHVLSGSKMVELLVALLKRLFGRKLGERIHVHRSAEELHQFIDKHLLPFDYGGEQKSIQEMNERWARALSGAEHVEYLCCMRDAAADESQRRGPSPSCAHALPGSIRSLAVD